MALALGMKVVAFDPNPKPFDGVEILKSIDEVIKVADVISLHCPSTSTTKGMINKDFLAKCKKDAYLINTARGDLVKDDDLIAHLEANKEFQYAADAWNGEPSAGSADWGSALSKHPRTTGSHHIGASTLQAETEIGEEAVRILGVFKTKNDIDDFNWVNKKDYKQKL